MIEEKDIYFSNDSNYRNWNDCFSSARRETKNVVFPHIGCRKRQYLELSFRIRSRTRRTSILMYHLEDFVNPTECNLYGYQLLHFIWKKKRKEVIEVRMMSHIRWSIYSFDKKINERSHWSTDSKSHSADNILMYMTKYNYSCQSFSAIANWTEQRNSKSEVGSEKILVRFVNDKVSWLDRVYQRTYTQRMSEYDHKLFHQKVDIFQFTRTTNMTCESTHAID